MALYLKYRPQDFNSLVGQGFIKETLKKAVDQDKTVGAYLFTGPRWTGKTSTARIFAKAINCENLKEGNPCNTCAICTSFAESSLVDIIEIDAASHTGVDNIREIIEKAQFRPTSTQYKIYIIDEVHMLSKGAFNALLKILEEPPAHVKFILATTEIHKVPETILSRCQRYDFKNHTDADVAERLKYIAKQEWVSMDEESCQYIVKNAEGGLRNAISLFEQLIVDNTISYTHIVETMWIAKSEEIENILSKMLSRDVSVLDDFTEIKNAGRNIKNIFREILSKLQASSIEKLTSDQSIANEIYLMEQIHETLLKTKNSFDESMTLQIGLLKILSPDSVSQNVATQAPAPAPVAKKIEAKDMRQPNEHMKEVIQDVEASTGEDFLSDVNDIFAKDDAFSDMGGNTTPKQDFDVSTLVEHTKKAGGKAALSMSLKGSDITLWTWALHIKAKTKISQSTIAKSENQQCILEACESMWLDVKKIELS